MRPRGCEPLKAGEVADATCFSETRMLAGPVPAQRRHTRSAFLAFRMATPVLSVEEGHRALVASLKSLQLTRRGMVG